MLQTLEIPSVKDTNLIDYIKYLGNSPYELITFIIDISLVLFIVFNSSELSFDWE